MLKVLSAKSPSESAKSAEYKFYQQDFPIYDGRYNVKKPMETTAPPIQLFHPVFGHFLDDLASNLSVPPEVAKATVRYMRAASGIYHEEEQRRVAIDPPLHEILGTGISQVYNADKTSPDGMVEVSLTGELYESVPIFIKEDKNDAGAGGCAATESGLSMARCWAQLEVNNTFLFCCL